MAGYSFIKQHRPDIGLVSFYDLGEIYSSDERDALFNLLLDPDALDQIYNLSRSGLSKEDIRTAGGLEDPVYHSLALSNETLRGIADRVQDLMRTDGEIGDPGKQNKQNQIDDSDNLIVLHGGLAANNIEFKYRDENGDVKKTVVPTSRESLFNSVVNSTTARTEQASYSSLLRIRRRSHINQLKLRATNLLIDKENIPESPTHIFNIPIYLRMPDSSGAMISNPNPKLLQCYCTVNSPLILPIRIGTSASLSFGREVGSKELDPPVPFIYGWELKLRSTLELVKSQLISDSQFKDDLNINISVTGTPAANKDCFLYVYLDAEQIKKIDFSGVGLSEEAGRDIGLIGFNNLEEIDISNNKLSSLPTWIKTLDGKLKSLDIRGNVWEDNGAIYSVFDHQDMTGTGISGVNSSGAPNATLVEFMSYSGYFGNGNGSKNANYKSYSTAGDENGKLYVEARKKAYERFKYVYNGNPDGLATDGTQEPIPVSVSNADGFRIFSLLEKLTIGSDAQVINGDFSRVFPNLVDISAGTSADRPDLVRGLIPKINPSTIGPMTINYQGQSQLKGSFAHIGETPFWTDIIDQIDDGDISSNAELTTATGVTTALTDSEIVAAPDKFIGRMSILSLNLRNTNVEGGILTGQGDVAGGDSLGKTHFVESNNVAIIAKAWRTWLSQIETFNFYSLGTSNRDVFVKVANGTSFNWERLSSFDLNHLVGTGGRYVKYNESVSSDLASDILTGQRLSYVEAYNAAWGGKIFSIAGVETTLANLQIGRNRWGGYTPSSPTDEDTYVLAGNLYKYLLPSNFVTKENTRLRTLRIEDLNSSFGSPVKDMVLRSGDLSIFRNLSILDLRNSALFGDFPAFSSNTSSSVITDLDISSNNFKDISTIGTTNNIKIQELRAHDQSGSYGGCRIPNFSKKSTNITEIHLKNNLPTNDYSGKPMLSCLANTSQSISTSHLGTISQQVSSIAGVTWTSSVSNGKIYKITASGSSFDIFKNVYVNDQIYKDSQTGEFIGVVTQIHQDGSGGYIHVDNVPSSVDTSTSFSGVTLVFVRKGQEVSNFFEEFTSLTKIELQNNRLVGIIPNFKLGKNITQIDLSNNLFTTWPGEIFTSKGLFSGTSRKLVRFNITNNPLSKEVIRSMIKELYQTVVANNNLDYRGLSIDARNTKWNSSLSTYESIWTKDDIFYNSVTKTIPDPSWVPPTKLVDSGEVDEEGDPIFVEVIDTSKTQPNITVTTPDPLLDQYKFIVKDKGLKFEGISSAALL